jgi:hypothetical protein
MPRIGISARLKDVMIATLNALTAIVLVNPVPWARAQMAFTLGFHIILVPLGVSWAFMTLIANYRAGSALVEVHGRDLCCRRGDRHRADL